MNADSQSCPIVLQRMTRWRLWMLLILMAVLLGLLGLESPNYFAYRKTVTQLQAEWTRRQDLQLPLQRDELAPLIAGSPRKVEVNERDFRADYFSWLGFLHDFHLGVTFDQSGSVTNIEESPPQFDPGYLGPENDKPQPKQRLTAQEVDAVLANAEKILRQEGATPQFRSLLNSVAESLPELNTSTVKGQLVWNSFDLPRNTRSLFAFQFLAPSSFGLDYAYCLSADATAVYDGAESWQSALGRFGIVSDALGIAQLGSDQKDVDRAFRDETRSLDFLADVQFEGVELPPKNFVRFGTRRIASLGSEPPSSAKQSRQVVWFFLFDDQPSQNLTGKVVLFLSDGKDLPARRQIHEAPSDLGNSPPRRGAFEICKHLGLPIKSAESQPRSVDVPQALTALSRHLESGRYGPAAFGRILRPVCAALPELKNSPQGTAFWQQLDYSQGCIAAVRVSIPESISGKVDLFGAIASEQSIEFGWDRHDLPLGSFRYTGIYDAPLSELLPPPPNRLSVFSSADGILNPGQEVVLWFRQRGGKEPASSPVFVTVTAVPHVDKEFWAEQRTPIHADTHPRTCGSLLGVSFSPPTASEGCFVLGWHDQKVARLLFTNDSRRLISFDRDLAIRLWDTETRQLEGTINMGVYYPQQFAASDDSRTLTMFSGMVMKQWDLSTQQEVATTAINGFADSMAVTTQPDEVVLALQESRSGGGGRLEMLSRFTTHRPDSSEWTTFSDSPGVVHSLQFLPDANLIAAGTTRTSIASAQGSIRSLTSVQIWPRDFTTPVRELPLGNDPGVYDLANTNPVTISYHPNGRRLAAISRNGHLKVWDLGTWTELFSKKFETPLLNVSLAPDGETVATTSMDEVRIESMGKDPTGVTVWNLNSGASQSAWQADYVPITHVTHSSDGKWVATASEDGVIRLWKYPPQVPLFDPSGDAVNLTTILAGLSQQERFIGRWTGKWDYAWKVHITISKKRDTGELELLYEWEEDVGQPMQRSGPRPVKFNDDTLVSGNIEMTLDASNPLTAEAIGKFKDTRTATLRRECP